ncbi:hypothetical protein KR018_001563 [Drosophila ironensis]|nr:hypothetical protein KR018_001563 [Drosophila ironensis]
MVNRLSEQLVEAKSKCSDYRKAVKLNVWGSDLDDISICLQMPRLEVLALSVNRIATLSALQNCTRLKELYLRKNSIASFDELNYLKNAQGLTSLWLEGNPCSEAAGDNYRACVLRKLPQLKKLDDVEVRDLELQSALRHEYYPEPKSNTGVSSIPEPTSSPRAKACRERMERERERVLEQEKEEREKERVREQERRRETYLDQEIDRDNYVSESTSLGSGSPTRRRSPDARFPCMATSPDELNVNGSRRAGNIGSPTHGDGSQDSSPRLSSSDHMRSKCIPQIFHSSQMTARGATVASAAAAAAMMAQGRPDRAYDMVANVSPQGVPYYQVGMPGAAGIAGATAGSGGIAMGNVANAEHQRLQRLRLNSNLLSAALCLIREMDNSTLESLSHAIHDQVTTQSLPY